MINCKTLIIFTSIVFLSAESRPFGDLLRTLIHGHLFHPHTRIVDHHHYYTDDIHRRNDHVHAPHYYYYEGYPQPHPPHGELLHRVHSDSDNQPGVVICCRVNPLKPHYKKPPTSPSVHQAEGHLEHHGNGGGVNHDHHVSAGLHTSVIYHGHGSSGHEPSPHVHQVVNCDKHQKEHDDKHHDEHNDKHHEDHNDEHHDEHHEDHSDEHHDKHHEDNNDEHHDKHHDDHSGEHHEGHDESGEHHDNKNYENQDKHHSVEHHSEEHHNDEHHDSNTSAIDELKMNDKPSYEVFENVSDVPEESSSKTNLNEISKKSEDNIIVL